MRIVISKKRLEEAVKNIGRVINPKNALPIMGDIMFSVDSKMKRIELLGSDGEIWLHYCVELADADDDGSFCIDAKLIKKALKGLKEQPITITTDTKGLPSFKLEHESGVTSLPIHDACEYPEYHLVPEILTEWILNADMLKRIIKRSLPATTDDELRPVMTGVFFEQTENAFSVVASDGHMLVHTAQNIKKTPGSFIMPKKAAKLLPNLLSGTEDVKVIFDERLAMFGQGNTTLTFRVIEGRYPNYMAVIPKDTPYSMKADRKSLLSALKNAANFASNKRLAQLSISSNQYMEVSCIDYDFETSATDRITIDYPYATDMKIGVHADHFGTLLSLMTENDITICFTDPSRAITITANEPANDGEEVLMLCMPMLLDD